MRDAALLEATVSRIAAPSARAADSARQELDRKTKPRGSLGRLEALAVQLAAVAGTTAPPPVRPAIVVAAGDHGYAEEGVSAYPQEVTRQMVANFAAGGAAICVLARELDAELVVVDAGVAEPCPGPPTRSLRVGSGTANATRGPAMTRADALTAIAAGIRLADDLVAGGATALVLGEMGIANTTAASAIHASLLAADPAEVCGAGTGLDATGIRRKVAVVRRALAANTGAGGDPVETLAALGGYEIALLVGAALGAAAGRALVVLDGFVVGAAALVAARLAPASVGAMVAGHLSPEPGHALGLRALGLEPLLDLRLRLGEGSGAALAIPLLRSARAILVEMATFDAAGVTDAGR